MTKKPALKRPLLKFEIEEAQANALSAAGAAKYLGVCHATYKKYAVFYGIYKNLLNKRGVGVAKGYAMSQKHSTKLKDIFENKHPTYPLQRLKWRMVARGLVDDNCYQCGFKETRITDDKKPVLMVFKDEVGDYTPSNLIVLCYNCCFLTKGAPVVVNKRRIERSLTDEEPKEINNQWINPEKVTRLVDEPLDDLTDGEIQELKREIDRDLGRT
jgi:hypothetical protein